MFYEERPRTGDSKRLIRNDQQPAIRVSNSKFDTKPTQKDLFYPKSKQDNLIGGNDTFIPEVTIEVLAPLNKPVGLTGLEVLDSELRPIAITKIEPLIPVSNQQYVGGSLQF